MDSSSFSFPSSSWSCSTGGAAKRSRRRDSSRCVLCSPFQYCATANFGPRYSRYQCPLPPPHTHLIARVLLCGMASLIPRYCVMVCVITLLYAYIYIVCSKSTPFRPAPGDFHKHAQQLRTASKCAGDGGAWLMAGDDLSLGWPLKTCGTRDAGALMHRSELLVIERIEF